jgi:hypothetical protein
VSAGIIFHSFIHLFFYSVFVNLDDKGRRLTSPCVHDEPCLKGQLHEIFDPRFFPQSTLPRALIHGVWPFRIWPRFHRENRQYSNNSISVGSLTPLKLFQWCH